MSSFDTLGLSPRALDAVRHLGYSEPTDIQKQAIPLVAAGEDVIAAAKTGTGKTAAFALPCMDALQPAPKAKGKVKKGGRKADQAPGDGLAADGRAPRMLVVTPTRELANQIAQVCECVGAFTRHRVVCVVGGVSYNPQVQALAQGADVLIATPGRLEDLMGQEAVDLSLVEKLVLDEADRMLDMGFLPSVKRIVQATPPTRQTLLFSATIDKNVQKVSASMMRSPKQVKAARSGDTADTVDQFVIRISQAAKPSLLKALLAEKGAERVIVFARTRHRADACARRIKKMGFAADPMHSDRTQNQRQRSLDAFSAGKVKVLVATDVLARGIDVSEVDYVVNYDLPTQPEDYVHRIGRTGRAGARGFAVSFVTPDNEADLAAIEKLTRQSIPEMVLADFDRERAEADAADRAAQLQARRAKDPEVAAVIREMAAKDRAERKKAAKKAQMNQEAEHAKKRKVQKKKGKPSAQAADDAPKAAPARKSEDAKRAPKKQGGKKAAAASHTPKKGDGRSKQASKGKKQGAKAAARQKSAERSPRAKAAPAREAAAKPAAKRDMRPGRSHRADMARQRVN